MSVDYYLVSTDKKIMMPFFTMNMGNIWMADKRYVFDFILLAGHEIRIVHEDDDRYRPDDEHGWTIINSREPYDKP